MRYFSAEEIAADTASRQAYIYAEGDYMFRAGTLFVSSVVDADGNTIAKNEDYSITLTEGYYTVNFAMLSMFGVQADVAQELNVEAVGSEGDDEEGDEENIYDTLCGWYQLDGYEAIIYPSEDGYVFNAYTEGCVIDNYYGMFAYEEDGYIYIYVYYMEHEAETGIDEFGIDGSTFVAFENEEGGLTLVPASPVEAPEYELALGLNTIDATDVTFSFVASTDGELFLALEEFYMGSGYADVYINGEYAGSLYQYDQAPIDLYAGDIVYIYVYADGWSAIYAEWTASAPAAASELKIGNTEISGKNATYERTASKAETLDLSIGIAIMGGVEIEIHVNGAYYGDLYTESSISIELEAGDTVTLYVKAEGYATLTATLA